jgi:hypothetical protein
MRNLAQAYFPINVTVTGIEEIGVMFVTKNGAKIYAEVELAFIPQQMATSGEAGTDASEKSINGSAKLSNGGTQLSSASNATTWDVFQDLENPFGIWNITLIDYEPTTPDADSKTIAAYFAEDDIADILFVLTYKGEVPMHPQMINLKP